MIGGGYDGFAIDIEEIEKGSTDRFFNAYMVEMLAFDISWRQRTLKVGESKSHNYCLLYNAWRKKFVFETPGTYKVHFRLRWNQTARDVVTAVAHVTVVGWDKTKEEDRRQLAALALWKDPEIAAFVQDKAELSGGALKKLEELKERYSDTLYGQLASDVLDRKQAP